MIDVKEVMLNPKEAWGQLDDEIRFVDTKYSANSAKSANYVRLGHYGFVMGVLSVDFEKVAKYFSLSSQAVKGIDHKKFPDLHLDAAFKVAKMHQKLNKTDIDLYVKARKLVNPIQLKPDWG